MIYYIHEQMWSQNKLVASRATKNTNYSPVVATSATELEWSILTPPEYW